MAIYKVGEGIVVMSPCSSTILAYIHNVPGPPSQSRFYTVWLVSIFTYLAEKQIHWPN